jgi:integrase
MFLASTGCRATEALSIRYTDLNETASPARILIRGEYTKNKTDRVVFLSTEMTKQLKLWLSYKHRTRRICQKNPLTNKTTTTYLTPKQDPKALIFALRRRPESQNSASFICIQISIQYLLELLIELVKAALKTTIDGEKLHFIVFVVL